MNQKGFTLIEIFVVIIIIALILGGILLGQQLLRAALVKSMIAQTEEVSVAFYAFQDRFLVIPGDYAGSALDAAIPLGNGNGRIDSPNEGIYVWSQLSAAKLLHGSYRAIAGESIQTIANSPANSVGGLWAVATRTELDRSGQWLLTGNRVNPFLLRDVDVKLDDGNPLRGHLILSVFQTNGEGVIPQLNVCAPGGSWSMESMGCGAAWKLK